LERSQLIAHGVSADRGQLFEQRVGARPHWPLDARHEYSGLFNPRRLSSLFGESITKKAKLVKTFNDRGDVGADAFG